MKMDENFLAVPQQSDSNHYDKMAKGRGHRVEPGHWPLTFAERQMATEQNMDPQSCAYCVNLALEITGKLGLARLEQALASLVNRHTAFRSYYPMENGEFVHRVMEEVPVSLKKISCTFDEAKKHMGKANVPFELQCAPLFRFTLYETGSESSILHLSIHHIMIDGVSVSVIFDELWRLYKGEELPPIEFDYTDYAAWQSKQAEDEKGKEFFTGMFADGVPENEMPALPRRPDALPFADVDCERSIDVKLVDEAARKYGVTTFRLLFAAAGLTLAKYCGSEDVTLGTAMSGRSSAQTAGMVGMFVNTLPVRAKVPGDMSVGEYVRAVADMVAEVKKHQTYPFEKIVSLLAPERNASRAPVFDVIVNYLGDFRFTAVPGLSIRMLPIKRQALAIDLMLELLREGDKLRIVISYSRQLYQDEVISNMMEQFTLILSRLAKADGKELLGEIAELPKTQMEQILNFAGDQCDENLGKTLVGLLRDQMKKTQRNRAVVFANQSLSYEELDQATDKIASYLAAKHVGRGNAVGILVNRSERMPVCAIGVMKSGAAYLPLDSGYPAERLEFMLEDAGCSVLIADEDLKDRVPGYQGSFLWTKDLAGLPGNDVPQGPEPEDTAVLLYTSGTTGKPKGVMLSQRNLVNFCTWYCNYNKITELDNIPAYASFGFDANIMDTYPTLMTGACLHVIPEEMRLDLPGLRDYFSQNKISIAFVTTQLGRQFAESMASRGLRNLLVGGEALVPIAPPKEYSLSNVYGPTECTVLSTAFHVDKLYDRVPIGSAVGNTALYVVDKQSRLAPVGVAGELCIAGRQVAKGYLNRPDITWERFVPNPFCKDPDYAVMYRTGDVVRFLPDGNIDFVGRSDFQVKIRGFRVELTEIEERIRAFPGVKDAAVVAADAPGGGKCAVAYLVGDSAIAIPELERFIEEELPSYMVPASTMQIERIPLNPNGKVDRRKLPPPSFSAGEENTTRSYNDLEKKLSEAAEGVLGHGDFGLTTNLLRAGLTSLSCIKLAIEIEKNLGIHIAVRDIMKDPTLLGIENVVIGTLLSKTVPEQARQNDKQDKYPLSQGQLGIYYECMKDPGKTRYNIPICVVFDKDTDVLRLQQAIEQLVNAHPALRTRLFMQEDEIWQSEAEEHLYETDIVAVDEEEMPLIKSTFVRPFHLFDEPLFRAKLCLTEKRLYLLLDFHHIVFDGTSLDIFMHELTRAYAGEKIEKESFTGFDEAQMEKEKEDGEEYNAAKAFYDRMMEHSEGATIIPYDYRENEKEGSTETIETMVEKASVAHGLEEMGITASSLFLGSVMFCTSRFANTKNVGIAAVSSGRGFARLQNTMGMFVKTLPFALDLDAFHSVKDYLDVAQRTMYEAVAHERYPYMKIASEYNYRPQILYAYQGALVSRHEIEGKSLGAEPLVRGESKFPIDVTIEEADGMYQMMVDYDSSRFSRQTMETYTECIAHMARQFATSCNSPLSNISIASLAQLGLVNGFSAQVETPLANAIHALFERQARKNPDAPALIASDGAFAYGQLNQRANRIAHALLEKGVEKGDRIAFMLPRTSHVFCAIYGIVKAGCAFIPVDPSYPRERIEYILADSGARFVIIDGESGFPNGLDINELIKHPLVDNPDLPVDLQDLCYIIYTSGSTGKPKGVMLAHRGIVNYSSPFVRNLEVMDAIDQNCVYLSVTTVSFDAFLWDIFPPLSNGLRVVMASDEEARNPVLLSRLCRKTGANAISTTPSVMMQYLEIPEMREALSGFKTLIIGAEKFPSQLYVSLRKVTNAVIINSYGPTEATVDCNCKIVTEDVEPISIGAPESGVLEQVMDMDGNPLPVGVTGELWIGGPGVAIGYLGKPELTAERFVGYKDVRYYRSGDLAKWNLDGEVLILGRNDSQIKLRGLRIELGEIENGINAYEGIKRVAILVRSIRGQEHLCAYYTAEREINPAVLRDALSEILPKYMVPSAFMQLGEMPVTPNGKIDTKALPDAQLMMGSDYEVPRTEMEGVFCKIFASVLGMDKVGANDNFFDLGGTSLLVTRVTVSAMNEGIDLVYNDVFKHPTPRGLAASLGEEATGQPAKAGADYDYGNINHLLKGNTIQALTTGERREVGNICLTGATGFLGIHILRKFIENEKGCAYCMVRGGKVKAENRLKTLLAYYFDDHYDDLFGSRIIAVDGDINEEGLYDRLEAYPIDTYINCAANVKHFSEGTDIWDINVGGVERAVAFCQKKKCRLIQISTCSVSGDRIDGSPGKEMALNEDLLYFGQDLSNQYLYSKFIAERIVLEAVANGLDAKVMRVGNLMAREADGEFQINFNTNSFLGLLKAYCIIGSVPYEVLNESVEFSSVDNTAEAVLILSTTPKECVVFHPFNNHMVFFRDIFSSLRKAGVPIRRLETDQWNHEYSEALKDPEKAKYLLSLFAYKSREGSVVIEPIAVENAYTIQALDRLGFGWPIVTGGYLFRFIDAMKGLGFFDDR